MSDSTEKDGVVKETIDGNYGGGGSETGSDASSSSRKSSLKLLATVNTTDRDSSDLVALNYDQVYQYGDEASLYSIAEDSREQRSELSSQVGDNVENGVPRMQSRGVSSAIEVSWVDPDSSDDGYDTDSMTGTNRGVYGPHNLRRCRLLTLAFVLILVIVAVTVGVLMSQRQDDNRSSLGTGVETAVDPNVPDPPPQTEGQKPETTGSGMGDPGQGRGADPKPEVLDESYLNLLAGGHVEQALKSCLGGQLYKLRDTNFMDNHVFLMLVEEEVAAAEVSDDGMTVEWSLSRGHDVIQERFALMMLYLSTGGEDWTSSDLWMTSADVCEWEGVDTCMPRSMEGSCAVQSINLSNHQLVGAIPQQLCCLPCIQTVNFVGNSILTKPDCLPMLVSTLQVDEEPEMDETSGLFGNPSGQEPGGRQETGLLGP